MNQSMNESVVSEHLKSDKTLHRLIIAIALTPAVNGRRLLYKLFARDHHDYFNWHNRNP